MKSRKIVIYTIKGCSYCDVLKKMLDSSNLEYTEVDGSGTDNDDMFEELYKVTNSYNVPTVIVGDRILVPEISFIKIKECFDIIMEVVNSDDKT